MKCVQQKDARIIALFMDQVNALLVLCEVSCDGKL